MCLLRTTWSNLLTLGCASSPNPRRTLGESTQDLQAGFWEDRRPPSTQMWTPLRFYDLKSNTCSLLKPNTSGKPKGIKKKMKTTRDWSEYINHHPKEDALKAKGRQGTDYLAGTSCEAGLCPGTRCTVILLITQTAANTSGCFPTDTCTMGRETTLGLFLSFSDSFFCISTNPPSFSGSKTWVWSHGWGFWLGSSFWPLNNATMSILSRRRALLTD